MSKIKITINNKEYQVESYLSILQACEQVGIEVPRFCYHEKLSVSGNCRMCLVEVQKAPKPVASCAMPIVKDMVIYTDTPLVKKAREAVIEFLLVNHPLDCPICDQGGECDLQDETLIFGSDRGRFMEYKRSVEDKECGPIVKTIMTRCIHCTRCVRFAAEVAGNETLGSFGRGIETEIGTYVQSFIKTELSGNLVDLCPVGALTSKPYSYIARNWELQKTETVDFFDGVCSDIIVQTRNLGHTKKNNEVSYNEDILRILPRLDGIYNENWISDRTRYAFDGLKKQRIESPLILKQIGEYKKISWDSILLLLSNTMTCILEGMFIKSGRNITPIKKVVGIIGSIADIEGIYAFSQFLKLHGVSDLQYGNYKLNVNIDAPFYYGLNRTLFSFKDTGVLFFLGMNLRYEASLLNTMLRKFQNRNALYFVSIGCFSPLRLKQDHLGNNVRTLLEVLENRISINIKALKKKNSSIIVGFESLKNKGGLLLQTISRKMGKKLYSKNRLGDRFGVLHANTATLGLSNLGIKSGVRSLLNKSIEKDKELSILFTWNGMDLDSSKWISSLEYTNIYSFGTHKLNTINADIYLPIKSNYEKDSFFYNIEGRLRKANKIVKSPKDTRTLESILYAISSIHMDKKVFLEFLWSFENELDVKISLDKVNSSFHLNFFQYNENEKLLPLFIFQPTITNFYMIDPITKASSVMGECSLFLDIQSNFKKHKKKKC